MRAIRDGGVVLACLHSSHNPTYVYTHASRQHTGKQRTAREEASRAYSNLMCMHSIRSYRGRLVCNEKRMQCSHRVKVYTLCNGIQCEFTFDYSFVQTQSIYFQFSFFVRVQFSFGYFIGTKRAHTPRVYPAHTRLCTNICCTFVALFSSAFWCREYVHTAFDANAAKV